MEGARGSYSEYEPSRSALSRKDNGLREPSLKALSSSESRLGELYRPELSGPVSIHIERPWRERLLDCFYPPSCPGCGAYGYGFCAQCRSKIVPVHEMLGADITVHAAGGYEKELRHALLQMKLLGYTYLAYALAEVMAQALPAHLQNTFPVAVVPMPSAKRRLRRRGYHCPSLLARALVRCFPNFIYRPDILRLGREPSEQKMLNRAERFANVSGAYKVENARELYILLVDDVMTTGATVFAASRALYEGGAMKVEATVVGLRR